MAPFGEHPMVDLQAEDKKEDEEDQNIWSSILKQVQASLPNKLAPHKLLLVLGDNESGKTTLIAKLQGSDDPKKGSGLEYHYIFVRDEYRDDHTRLGVWVLDGDPWHRNLLKYALNEETLEDTTVILTGAMTHPWNVMESLNNWASVLEEHLGRLKTPHALMERLRTRALHRYQDYIEPGDEIDGVAVPLRSTSFSEDDPSSAAIPLGEDTLTRNLGLDIIVVITKTDYMGTLEKNYDFKDEHFDFIQQAVRKFCLKYGAALFYTSVKEDKNCDLLYKYLVHRIYSFPFRTPALVVEKDAVFVPSGWDNDKKIAILYENITSASPDDPYGEIITKPMTRKPLQREPEVSSEDDQLFLVKLQGLLNQQVPTAPGRGQETAMRTPVGVQKSADRRLSGAHVAQGPPKKDTEFAKLSQVDGAKGAGGNEGVLQNFFNSLLNRKTGSAGGAPNIRTDKAVVRSDAAAELERMTRSMGKNRAPQSSTAVTSAPPSIDDSTSGNNTSFST